MRKAWECRFYTAPAPLFLVNYRARYEKVSSTVLKLRDCSQQAGNPRAFSGFTFEETEVPYTCSNGKNLKSPELLIRNFE